MNKEGTDGEQDIMKAYKAAHEEIDDSTDEHVPDGASSALINRVRCSAVSHLPYQWHILSHTFPVVLTDISMPIQT